MHVIIAGKVQGVWFRASTANKAQELGVQGWARNLSDGTVEVFALGNSKALNSFLDWCRRGPSGARVDAVDARFSLSAEQLVCFSVLPDGTRPIARA
ncbi:MAG: acylphosphatase [Pseudomonadota bacterium]